MPKNKDGMHATRRSRGITGAQLDAALANAPLPDTGAKVEWAKRWNPIVVEQAPIDESLSDEDRELAADVRAMKVPASVLTDPIARALWLSQKNAAKTSIIERSQKREEKEEQRSAEKQAKAQKREERRQTRAQREANAKPRTSKDGMISANQIASELKLLGREVRGALRSMGIKKPDGGWWFSLSDVAVIKDKVMSCQKRPRTSPPAPVLMSDKSTDASPVPSNKPSAKSKNTTKAKAPRQRSTKQRKSSKTR